MSRSDELRKHNEYTEHFRKVLMQEHADDWDMETVAEAAYICSNLAVQLLQSQTLEAESRGVEVLASALHAVGGEVTMTKADLVDMDKCSLMQYRNLDGSVTYRLELNNQKKGK